MFIRGLEHTLEDRISIQKLVAHPRPLSSLAREYESQSSESAGSRRVVFHFLEARLQSLYRVTLNCMPVLMHGSSLNKCVNQIIHGS